MLNKEFNWRIRRTFFHSLLPILLVLNTALFQSCAPSLLVKPLKKGEQGVSAHLGGPLIRFAGTPIPVPLSGLEYHYGWKDKLSLSGGLGLTSLAFGTFQLSAGGIYQIKDETGLLKTGVSALLKGHFLLDRWEKIFRFYPEAGMHFYRQFGKHNLYAGGSAWFETQYGGRKRSSRNLWVPMLHAGWQKAEGKWRPSVEIKWIAPGQDSGNLVVDYIGPASRGSMGLYFGISRLF